VYRPQHISLQNRQSAIEDAVIIHLKHSRSYCYTVWLWSANGIILSSVRLSVTLCIMALRVGVQG